MSPSQDRAGYRDNGLGRKAAGAGDTRAKFNLALAYEVGSGVEVDTAKYLQWLLSAAEDGERAHAYVLMLRKAMELGGFHQCIFVSHNREVYEMADAQIYVGGGIVSGSQPDAEDRETELVTPLAEVRQVAPAAAAQRGHRDVGIGHGRDALRGGSGQGG